MQASETRLTYLIGPIARIVMRRALPHASTRQALLQALAEHIPDPFPNDRYGSDTVVR